VLERACGRARGPIVGGEGGSSSLRFGHSVTNPMMGKYSLPKLQFFPDGHCIRFYCVKSAAGLTTASQCPKNQTSSPMPAGGHPNAFYVSPFEK